MIIDILETKIAKPIHSNVPHLPEWEKKSIMSRVLQTQTGKDALVDAVRKNHESGREAVTDQGQSIPSKCGDLILLILWLSEFDLGDEWLLEIMTRVPITQKEIDFWYATHATFAEHIDKHWPNLKLERK